MAEVKAYFGLNALDEAVLEDYKRTWTRLKELSATLCAQFKSTPEFEVVKASSSNRTPTVRLYHSSVGYPVTAIEVTYQVNIPAEPRKYLSIDASILNQLLNSKLLTDEEKRDLLREQGILKPKEVVEDDTPLYHDAT